MVWPCLKIFWFSKDNSAGYNEWKKRRDRQKKRLEDNIKEWAGVDFDCSTRAAMVENVCCYVVICGAPMTLQGYGID